MALRCAACVRFACNGLRTRLAVREFRTDCKLQAAQSYAMPAMSPTMTEGNISRWNVKEGESFSAGDVLLEIETDKASMDVEAQDDGILAKIMQPGGTKGVKVGTRIAILADVGDELSSLKIPVDIGLSAETEANSVAKQEPFGEQHSAHSGKEGSVAKEAQRASSAVYGSPQGQRYPLYPSVVQLLQENGLSNSEADKIPATGPKGRLLKGDVLAYLGAIKPSYVAEQSRRISNLGNLDLSYIKTAEPRSLSQDLEREELTPVEELHETELAVTISFEAIQKVQQRIHKTLDIDIPLETFISRAIEISNIDLPTASQLPTYDELFNEVLGFPNVENSVSQGSYVPQITTLPSASHHASNKISRYPDIIDVLSGIQSKPVSRIDFPSGRLEDSRSVNVSITAAKGEEQRVQTFLERMKNLLQFSPGKLVL